MDRRQLMIGGFATGLLRSAAPVSARDAGPSSYSATLSLDKTGARAAIPEEFTGLSYESAQLANPGYFSRENRQLVTLFRQLGARGVLRLGGSTSDYDSWKPERVGRRGGWSDPVNPDDGKDATVRGVVTQTAVDELRGFLDATGWTAIYGIDLGHGSPQSAAEEAAYVAQKLGPKLLALQIGNEPDLYSKEIRKPSYGYDDYFREWQGFADAIRRRVPHARLAGPDVSDDLRWVERFAADASGICMLTSHYYAEGPPESADSDIGHLLRNENDLTRQMQRLVESAKSIDVPYRMSEGNSCYNGGKAGVSDAFASALWGADFMLLLAQLGVAGINFHGGGRGFYTPIAGGGSAPYVKRPLYSAMLFWRAFASGSMLPCRLKAGDVNATAYACFDAKHRLAVAIVNKDLHRGLSIRLDGEEFRGPSREIALTAPGIDSTDGIHLGGQDVSTGTWHPTWSRPARSAKLTVPRASALLVEWEGVSL